MYSVFPHIVFRKIRQVPSRRTSKTGKWKRERKSEQIDKCTANVIVLHDNRIDSPLLLGGIGQLPLIAKVAEEIVHAE